MCRTSRLSPWTIFNRSTHDVRVRSINLLWEHDGQHGGRMLFERSAPLPSDEAQAEAELSGPMLRAMTELPDTIKPYDSDHATAGGARLNEAMPRRLRTSALSSARQTAECSSVRRKRPTSFGGRSRGFSAGPGDSISVLASVVPGRR